LGTELRKSCAIECVSVKLVVSSKEEDGWVAGEKRVAYGFGTKAPFCVWIAAHTSKKMKKEVQKNVNCWITCTPLDPHELLLLLLCCDCCCCLDDERVWKNPFFFNV